jgi:hypothetical protein
MTPEGEGRWCAQRLKKRFVMDKDNPPGAAEAVGERGAVKECATQERRSQWNDPFVVV